jgi:hypothetical protein
LCLRKGAGGQLAGKLVGQSRDDLPAIGLKTERRVCALRAQKHGGAEKESHGVPGEKANLQN